MWVYLNWALGFKSIGYNVIWMEYIKNSTSDDELSFLVTSLKQKLESYNLFDCLALCTENGSDKEVIEKLGCLNLSAADQSDMLINQRYSLHQSILNRFKKTVFLDIDPGLTQLWMTKGVLLVAPHDIYYSIGETVGQPDAKFSDAGIKWQYTPPCVSLDWWPVALTSKNASLTTVAHWSMDEWAEDAGELYSNDKRTGFLPFLQLPKYSRLPLELAILLDESEQEERGILEGHGWQVKDSHNVASSPQNYQNYIQGSLGEFSCVKPSCVRLQNAWISDRTICYLASGKPAIVEHTGPSRFLPDRAGLLRFKTFNEAIQCIEEAESNYAEHSRLARALAEEYFDATKVTRRLLERVS